MVRASASVAACMGDNDYVFKRMARVIFHYTRLRLFAPEGMMRIQKTLFIDSEFRSLEYFLKIMKRKINLGHGEGAMQHDTSVLVTYV